MNATLYFCAFSLMIPGCQNNNIGRGVSALSFAYSQDLSHLSHITIRPKCKFLTVNPLVLPFDLPLSIVAFANPNTVFLGS